MLSTCLFTLGQLYLTLTYSMFTKWYKWKPPPQPLMFSEIEFLLNSSPFLLLLTWTLVLLFLYELFSSLLVTINVFVKLHKTAELRILPGLFFFWICLEMYLSKSLTRNFISGSQTSNCWKSYTAKHSVAPFEEREYECVFLCPPYLLVVIAEKCDI